jgi:DNA ligase N terminus/UBA-like domain
MSAAAAAQLVEMLGIEQERAAQLLEATTGSIDRALELHFSSADGSAATQPSSHHPAVQTKQKSAGSAAASPVASKKKKASSIAASKKSPQKSIASFFAVPTGSSSSSSTGNGSTGTATAAAAAAHAASTAADAAVAAPDAAVADTAADEADTHAVTSTASPARKRPKAVAEPEVSLDSSILELAWTKYKPVTHACWKAGAATPYLHLANTFDALTNTRSRLRKADILTNCFHSLLALSPEDLLPAVFMCSNKIAENLQGVDLGVGGAQVSAAIIQVINLQWSLLFKNLLLELDCCSNCSCSLTA